MADRKRVQSIPQAAKQLGLKLDGQKERKSVLVVTGEAV
jgi:hypothetical protein